MTGTRSGGLPHSTPVEILGRPSAGLCGCAVKAGRIVVLKESTYLVPPWSLWWLASSVVDCRQPGEGVLTCHCIGINCHAPGVVTVVDAEVDGDPMLCSQGYETAMESANEIWTGISENACACEVSQTTCMVTSTQCDCGNTYGAA